MDDNGPVRNIVRTGNSLAFKKHFLISSIRYGEDERDDGEKMSGLQLLVATFKHWIFKPYQWLIIPLTFWSGIEQGFFGADFTAV